jgi:hypothetical protein
MHCALSQTKNQKERCDKHGYGEGQISAFTKRKKKIINKDGKIRSPNAFRI